MTSFLSRILVCILVVVVISVCVCRNRLLIIQNYAQVAKIIAFDDCVSIELGKKKEKRERSCRSFSFKFRALILSLVIDNVMWSAVKHYVDTFM